MWLAHALAADDPFWAYVDRPIYTQNDNTKIFTEGHLCEVRGEIKRVRKAMLKVTKQSTYKKHASNLRRLITSRSALVRKLKVTNNALRKMREDAYKAMKADKKLL